MGKDPTGTELSQFKPNYLKLYLSKMTKEQFKSARRRMAIVLFGVLELVVIGYAALVILFAITH
jgi:hypothetical protein